MAIKREHLELINKSHDFDSVQESVPGKKSNIITWLFLLILTIVLTGYIWFQYFSVTKVTIARVIEVKNTIDDTSLDAVGYVVPLVKATVSSQVSGEITEILVDEGDVVEKGDVVARLDKSIIQQQLVVAESAYQTTESRLEELGVRIKQATRDLDRTKSLIKENFISESQLDDVQLRLSVLKAQYKTVNNELLSARESYKLIDRQLQQYTVIAPFSGVVISKRAQPGEIISPGSESEFTRSGICTIVDMDSLIIEVDVNESYINKIFAGQIVKAKLDAYPDWVINAEVIRYVPSANRHKATVKVQIKISELDSRILPDMGVRVKFFNQNHQADKGVLDDEAKLVISSNALFEHDSKSYVWLVEDNYLYKKQVVVEEVRKNRAIVREGLEENQSVVTSGFEGLREGMQVSIEN